MARQRLCDVDAQHPHGGDGAHPMAAVITEIRASAPSWRIVAAWRRCAGLAFLTAAMGPTVRVDPDTYMKKQVVRLRIP